MLVTFQRKHKNDVIMDLEHIHESEMYNLANHFIDSCRVTNILGGWQLYGDNEKVIFRYINKDHMIVDFNLQFLKDQQIDTFLTDEYNNIYNLYYLYTLSRLSDNDSTINNWFIHTHWLNNWINMERLIEEQK